jgi:hypothetical protein
MCSFLLCQGLGPPLTNCDTFRPSPHPLLEGEGEEGFYRVTVASHPGRFKRQYMILCSQLQRGRHACVEGPSMKVFAFDLLPYAEHLDHRRRALLPWGLVLSMHTSICLLPNGRCSARDHRPSGRSNACGEPALTQSLVVCIFSYVTIYQWGKA